MRAAAVAGLAMLALVGDAAAQASPAASDGLPGRYVAAVDGFTTRRAPLTPPREVSFDFRSIPLDEALEVIATRAGLRLVYADGLLPPGVRVSARGDRVAPEHAFALVLLETPLKVVTLPTGYAAVVWRESAGGPTVALSEQRRFLAVSRPATGTGGVVLGPDERPMPGAYVRLCGTRRVELTDSLGRFAFAGSVPRGARVSVSSLGHREEIVQLRPGTVSAPPAVLRLDVGEQRSMTPSCRDR